MRTYALVADEDDTGARIAWKLLESADGDDWEQIVSIGALPVTDAKDWATSRITGEADRVIWTPSDGTVFAPRWSTWLSDPWD